MCGPLDFICQGIAGGVEGAWQTVTMFLFGWLYAVPWWGWLVAGMMIGAELGARFGRLALFSIVLAVAVGWFASRSGAQPPTRPLPPEPWEEPESRHRNPKSLSDILDEINQKWRR